MNTMLSIEEIGQRLIYPGRFLIIGSNSEYLFHFYGVTARSASSRAKRYVHQPKNHKVVVAPTDVEIMAQGDLSLLDYTAAYLAQDFIIIGNGQQTDRVRKMIDKKDAQEVLKTSLAEEEYEHDNYRTPRITGCSLQIDGIWTQGIHIIRSGAQGESIRDCYAVNTQNASTFFISTYAGPNIRPTPSFQDEPYALALPAGTIEEVTRTVYAAFAPRQSGEDLRVSLISIRVDRVTAAQQVYIINAVDA